MICRLVNFATTQSIVMKATLLNNITLFNNITLLNNITIINNNTVIVTSLVDFHMVEWEPFQVSVK